MAQKIEAYLTSDGKIFPSKAEAEKHEQYEKKKKIEKAILNEIFSWDIEEHESVLYKFGNLVVWYRKELKSLLNSIEE